MFAYKVTSARQMNYALLVLRMAAGLTLAAHGYQKVFTYGIAGVTGGFESMGIPLASVAAPLVSVLELVGGIMVAVGLFARPIALLLAFDMFTASTFVHLKDGFFAPKGAELTLLLLCMSLAIAIAGAGAYSVEANFRRNGNT